VYPLSRYKFLIKIWSLLNGVFINTAVTCENIQNDVIPVTLKKMQDKVRKHEV